MARCGGRDAGPAATSAAERAGDVLVSRTFARAEIGDAIADAVRWLGEQPPASREVVFAGAFPRGSVTAGDLRAVPQFSGHPVYDAAARRPTVTWSCRSCEASQAAS